MAHLSALSQCIACNRIYTTKKSALSGRWDRQQLMIIKSFLQPTGFKR